MYSATVMKPTVYPVEFLNIQKALGLPAHQITLEIGVPIILCVQRSSSINMKKQKLFTFPFQILNVKYISILVW